MQTRAVEACSINPWLTDVRMTAQCFATVKSREHEPHMCRRLLVRIKPDATIARTFQTFRGQWLERFAPCGFLAFLFDA